MHKVDYIMGDLHLGSRGMFKRIYSKEFDSIAEYHEALVERWNKKVTRDDAVVWVLGDMGHKEFFDDVLPKLRGRKMLILGNHDNYSKTVYEKYFEEVFSAPVFVRTRIVLSHIPIPVEPGILNFHGHTHLIKLKSDFHYNMCPEWWDYIPVLFKKLEGYLGKVAKPDYHFMSEWYADIQTTDQEGREDLVFVEGTNLIDVEPTKKLVIQKKYEYKKGKAEAERIAAAIVAVGRDECVMLVEDEKN